MRRIRPILPVVAGLASLGCAQQAMTLPQALSQLEQGNGSLKAADAKVETARETHKASYGNFMPVVMLEGNVFHLDRTVKMDLNAVRSAIIQTEAASAYQSTYNSTYYSLFSTSGNAAVAKATAEQVASQVQTGLATGLDAQLPAFEATMAKQNDWSAAVTAYQPLFHGGKILAAEKITGSQAKAAEATREKQKADLRRDFTKYYVQGSLLKQSIRLRQDAIVSIERHKKQAQSAVNVGMADKAALLRAEMALSEAQTALSDDSSKLQSIQLTLAQMAGEDGTIDPADSVPPPPQAPGSADEIEKQTEQHNPLLNTLAAQQEVAHKAVAVKTADFMPSIGLFGKYNFNRDAQRSALQPIWAVGIKGEMTLFHGGDDYHARQAALSTEREVAALRAEAKSALNAQAQRQVLALQQARTHWEHLNAQCDLARENHRVTEAKFTEGQATGLEVVDAWLTMQKADLERLAAAGDGWLDLNEILWAEGNTSEFVNTWTGARK